ncbi:queuine tRNA-ribosyltransferase [Tubulinosema ratisbonensis]|uniref:Queuine tRNA-ribosyltransferase n=1 Tax=Tubulinosema ratisbonensis TaxID=291195 RepID=A0A437ANM0_9MICR|nr:queuine tRNA-ribosyltransferase [Tubulinosema ratisbonensis]
MTEIFKILKQDKYTRTSILKLSTDVELPRFMPVATYASMKSVPFEYVDTNLFLCNAYHCRKLKNLKEFMGTDKNILTDSGGFQIGSLNNVKVLEEGVLFDDDGKINLFTPEDSMKTQIMLGSNIIMQLDDVVNPKSDYETVKEATLRSLRWLKRCLKFFNEFSKETMNLEKENEFHTKKIKQSSQFVKNNQILMPIIQGGCFLDLRDLSIKSILELNPPAIAIGGLSGGEDKTLMFKTILHCTKQIKNIPIYVMGIGYPEDVLLSFALGCDMMDCVYPTRTARFGKMFDDFGDINLLKPLKDRKKSECQCFTCKNYSLEYLGLIKNTTNFCSLVSIHNLFYMNELGRRVRETINDGSFDLFLKKYFENRYNFDVPCWVKEVLSWVEIKF